MWRTMAVGHVISFAKQDMEVLQLSSAKNRYTVSLLVALMIVQ